MRRVAISKSTTTAILLSALLIVSSASIGLSVGTAQAAYSCGDFNGWSIESESGDSVVNTGLAAQMDISNGETYYILEEDTSPWFGSNWDVVKTVSGSGEEFISRSTLKDRQDIDGNVNLRVSYESTGTYYCTGSTRTEGTDFSIGPDTVQVLQFESTNVVEGESITATVTGWSTKSSFDVSIKESDTFFDDTYTTETVYPDGNNRGKFEKEITFTPSEQESDDAAEVYSTGGGVSNLGGTYTISINENQPPEITDPAYSPSTPQEGDTVYLSTYVSDPDGDSVSIEWSQVSGPSVNLGSTKGDSTSFDVPDLYNDQTVTLKVTATDSHGGTSSKTVDIPVNVKHNPPTADFSYSPTNPSTGESVSFTEQASDTDGTVLDYKWDFDDDGNYEETGYTPSHTFSTTGDHPVTLKVIDDEGDSDTITKTVSVEKAIDAKILGFDYPTGSFTIGEKVTSTVKVENTGTQEHTFFVGYSAWGPNEIAYDNHNETGKQVTLSPGEVRTVSVSWTVQETGPNGEPLPSGSYDLETKVWKQSDPTQLTTSLDGQRVSDVITVNYPPEADAGGSYSVAEGESISLDSSGSSDQDGSIQSVSWSVVNGPGSISGGTYTAPSELSSDTSATVEVTVTDDNGATDTATATVSVSATNDAPTAKPDGPFSVKEGASVTLTDSSTDEEGSLQKSWSLVSGPGTVSQGTYHAPDTMSSDTTATVRLTVTDSGGKQATAEAKVSIQMVNDAPTADAGGDYSTAEGGTVDLQGSGSDEEGSITKSWQVTDGPGSVSNGVYYAPSSVSSSTSATVKLTVSDEQGKTTSDTATVSIAAGNDIPSADAGGPYSVAEESDVVLDASGSTDSDGSIQSVSWSIVSGPGSISGGTYFAPSSLQSDTTVTVQVTVVDDDGESATDTATISVSATNDPPVAKPNGPFSVKEGGSVTLSDSSTDEESSLEKSWSIVSGPGSISNGVYTAPESISGDTQTVTVELTVTDADGKTDSATTTITVGKTNTAPTASFSLNQSVITVGENIRLDAAGSEDPDGPDEDLTYSWQLVEPSGENLALPAGSSGTVTFPDQGTYVIELTVTDAEGASDTVQKSITVEPDASFSVSLSASDSEVTTGTSVTFDASVSGNQSPVTYSWDLNNDGTFGDASGETVTQTFDTPGTYTVRVKGSTDAGDATSAVSVTVSEKGTVSIESSPGTVNTSTLSLEWEAFLSGNATGVAYRVDHGELQTVVQNSTITTPTGTIDLTNLSDGPHTVQFVLLDESGNQLTWENATVTVEFSVDTVGPTLQSGDFGAPPTTDFGESTTTNGTVTVETNLTDRSGIASVEAIIQPEEFDLQKRVTAEQVGDTWTASFGTGTTPVDGNYTLTLIATDNAGNTLTQPVGTVEIDSVSPEIGATVSRTDSGQLNVEVTSSEPLSTTPTVDIKHNGTTTTVNLTQTGDQSWQGTITPNESGTYRILATGEDHAGNQGAGKATTHLELTVNTSDKSTTIGEVGNGTFVTLRTEENVSNGFAAVTESETPLGDLYVNQTGVGFIDGRLGDRLSTNLTNATIGIPVEKSTLPSGVEPSDVRIHYYNETTESWEPISTTVETRNGQEYWIATVSHFSVYGAITTDYVEPSVTHVSPEGSQYTPNETVSIEFSFDDSQSGIDYSSLSLTVDGTNVLPSAEVTSNSVTYELTELNTGNHTVTFAVADEAGNVVERSITYTVDAPDEEKTGNQTQEDKSEQSSKSSSTSASGGRTKDSGPSVESISTQEGVTVNVRDAEIGAKVTANISAGAVSANGASVRKIELKMKFADDSFRVEVTDPQAKPSKAPPLSTGTPLQYFRATTYNVKSSDIDHANIYFSVKSDNLPDGVTQSDISLYRYHDGSWQKLETKHLQGDTYMATTPGFSTFAIAANPDAQATATASPTPTKTATPRKTLTSTSNVTPTSTSISNDTTETTSPGFGFSLSMISILAALVLLHRRD